MSAPLTQPTASAEAINLQLRWRVEPRYHCQRLARVCSRKGPQALARLSIVRNISLRGIGLFLTQALEPGTLVDVELRSRFIIKRVAQVVHSTKQEGGWLVGCTFDSPLSASQLEALQS